jgi:hypothetical protein
MKLGHACTFPNKPCGETPAPLAENRAPALPRPLARRALSSQIAGRVCHAVLAVLRAMDAASILRLAGTVLAQALHAWRPGQASATVPRHARRLAGAGPPHPSMPVCAYQGPSDYGSDILNGRNRPQADDRDDGACEW